MGENSKAVDARLRKQETKKATASKEAQEKEDKLWADDDKNLAKKKQKKEEEERKRLALLAKKEENSKSRVHLHCRVKVIHGSVRRVLKVNRLFNHETIISPVCYFSRETSR